MVADLLILQDAFIVVVLIWGLVLLVAPVPVATAFWRGGALWLLASTGVVLIDQGLVSDPLLRVIGQLFVWLLLAPIIFARDYVEDDRGAGLGAATRTINALAFIGRLITDGTDQDQQRHRQHQPPWQREQQPRQDARRRDDHDNAAGRPDDEGDVFAGLDLDTGPLRDNDDQ